MVTCKSCQRELQKFPDYYLCSNQNCYFFEVPRLCGTFKVSDKPNIKPKGKFEEFKQTAKTVFNDIKDEMGKTLVETKDTLNKQGIGYNKDTDAFDTEFGRIESGGL